MTDRPILPIGQVLSHELARRAATYYRAEVEAEAERVAAILRAQGHTGVRIAYAGVDFNPATFVNRQRPRTTEPADAVVELALVSWDAVGFPRIDYCCVVVCWESGIVACDRDL
jgi:hypothetical protein